MNEAASDGADNTAERLTTANLKRGMTMATKHHKSKARPSRNRAPRSTPSGAIPATESREEIIENERARLMKASSILACVTRAMEGDGVCTGNGPYWPAAIESAGELIEEAIRKLEGVREPEAMYEVVDGSDWMSLDEEILAIPDGRLVSGFGCQLNPAIETRERHNSWLSSGARVSGEVTI